MLPGAVVEHLDVRDDIVPSLLTGGVRPMRRPLTFYAPEKPLRHRIVETLAFPAHATHHVMFL